MGYNLMSWRPMRCMCLQVDARKGTERISGVVFTPNQDAKRGLVSSRKGPAISGPPSLRHSARIRRVLGYTPPRKRPEEHANGQRNAWFLPSKKPSRYISTSHSTSPRFHHPTLACMLSQGVKGACSYTTQYPAAAHRDLTPPCWSPRFFREIYFVSTILSAG